MPKDLTENLQKDYFANNHFNGRYSLSERITRLDVQDQVIESINVQLQRGVKLNKLVNELKGLTKEEDISSKMRNIERTARRVIQDPSQYADLSRTLQNAKAEILTRIDEGDATRLDKAYLKIVNAAENLNEEGLNNAIEAAIDEKAMANAFRIATTEVHRAYNKRAYTLAKDDPDCLAMQLDLSSAGNNCEDCVDLSEMDNGAGPGIYPMDSVPDVPVHPHCRCLLTPVYRLPDDMDPEELEVEDDDYDVMESMPKEVLGEDEE